MKIVEIKTKLMKFNKFLKKKQNYGNLTKIVGYWPDYRIWPKFYLLKFHSNVQNFSSPAYTKLPTVFIIMTFNMHFNVMLTHTEIPYHKNCIIFICFIRTFHFNQLLGFLISGEKKENLKKTLTLQLIILSQELSNLTLKLNIYLIRFMLNLRNFLNIQMGLIFF